jgi:thiol-disulfide isomerase/thioredoxin
VPQGFPSPVRFAFVALAATLVATAAPALAGNVEAPAFSVKSLDGRSVRFSDYRNRPVIVDFWATWCAPCRASMPHLNDLNLRYGPKGLAVIGMSVDDTGPLPVRRFASGLGLKFTLAMANDDILDAYGPIRSIPTTIFINRKGEIVRRVVGYIDKETLEGYVVEIMP